MERAGCVFLVIAFLLVFPRQGTAQNMCYSDIMCDDSGLLEEDVSVDDCCTHGGMIRAFETPVGEACTECRVYGWKGGTTVREMVGGELVLSMAVVASEGQELALSVGYTTGVADRPRTFTLDYDGDDLEVILPAGGLNLLTEDLPVTIRVLEDDVKEEEETISLTLMEVNFNIEQGKYFVSNLAIVIAADQPEVNITLEQAMYTVSEEEGSLEICVSAIVPSNFSGSVTANLSAIPGTADAADYSIQDPTLTFSETCTTDCATVIVTRDGVFEGDENFQVVLSAPDGVNVIRGTAIVNIIDSDSPPATEIGFFLSIYTVSEEQGMIEVCAEPTQPEAVLTRDLEVMLRAEPGTAESGVDYRVTSADMFLTPANPAACITIQIVLDDILEDNETFAVILTSTDTGVSLQISRAEVVIMDSTVEIGFDQSAYTFTEEQGLVWLFVVPTQPGAMLTRNLDVLFSVQPITVDERDYFINSSLDMSLTPMDPRAFIDIIIYRDGVYEDPETLSVTITSLSPGVAIGIGEAIVEIQNIDNAQITVTPSSLNVSEGEGEQSVCLMVSQIDNKTSINAAVAISNSSATATEGVDYVVLSGFEAVLSLSQSRWCFRFRVLSDSELEGTESFTIVVSARETMVDIDPDMVTVVINDVPPPPDKIDIGFTQSVYVVSEDVGMIVVCAEPTQPEPMLTRDLEVMLRAEPGTAENGTDYRTVSADMFLTPVNLAACITIAIIMDNTVEDTESFVVTLTSDDPEVSLQIDRAVVMIEDSSVPPTAPPVTINDTVSGDPMMTVPINAISNDTGDATVSLCYEIHGRSNGYFNLISDTCLSVNAHYTSPRDDQPINVIDQIAVVATNQMNINVEISVDLAGCTATVDGVEISRLYHSEGILVRKFSSQVTIFTTNCQDQTVVMRVFCHRGPIGDDLIDTDMIRLVVGRNASLTESSHGIVGQFWNIPIDVTVYNQSTNRFLVTVRHPDSPSRRFVGELYDFNWIREKMPCLYVGDRQGAKGDGSHGGPNDPVIEGVFSDYEVRQPFDTEYRFSRFGVNSRK